MNKIIALILLICFALAVYSFVFQEGQILSFEESYTNCMRSIMKIGEKIQTIKDAVSKLFNNIRTIFSSVHQFFQRIYNFFVKLISPDTPTVCLCEDPSSCYDCKCNADDCDCGGCICPDPYNCDNCKCTDDDCVCDLIPDTNGDCLSKDCTCLECTDANCLAGNGCICNIIDSPIYPPIDDGFEIV